ncbi:MAG: nuclear transport factor 2 family protein [Pseudomonadota bacterium]
MIPLTHKALKTSALAILVAATAPIAAQAETLSPVDTVVVPLFDAVAKEDLAAASAYLVDGAPIHAMFNPNGSTDAASVRTFPAVAYFTLVTRNYENIVFRERTYSVSDDGKTVWMEANGDLRLEKTGTPYRNRYVFKFSLNKDGKVTEIREWVNTVTLTRQGITAN